LPARECNRLQGTLGKLPGHKIIRASRDGEPAYLAQRERVYDGTRKAGMPEE